MLMVVSMARYSLNNGRRWADSIRWSMAFGYVTSTMDQPASRIQTHRSWSWRGWLAPTRPLLEVLAPCRLFINIRLCDLLSVLLHACGNWPYPNSQYSAWFSKLVFTYGCWVSVGSIFAVFLGWWISISSWSV